MRIRTKIFEMAEAYGYRSLRELSRAMGISDAQLVRVRKDQRRINESFIAGAMQAFPGKSFDDLFTVEASNTTDPAA